MGDEPELSYTRREILDYLPGGWVLSDPAGAGSWNAGRSRWEVALRDICDVEWELRVEASAAGKSGRVEALKDSVDHLFRAALG